MHFETGQIGKMSVTVVESFDESRSDRERCLYREWSGPCAYEPLEYFSPLRVLVRNNFANYRVTRWPWLLVIMFSIFWTLALKFEDKDGPLSLLESVEGLDNIVSMFGGTLSILLAFRLARAAVRYYDARFK
jgi:hypothetical protein